MKPKFEINEFENLKNKDIVFECEVCGNEFNSTKKYLRRALGITKHPRKPSLKYCSKECNSKGRMTGEYLKCSNCEKEIYRNKKEIDRNESGEFFCGYVCNGEYWNKNKNYGINRSKLEIWTEEILKSKYDFEIKFNDREVLSKYELDIYIPKLNLAFELNGIFHYEPIFGEDKLKVTKNKDLEKAVECMNKKIELITIDVSDSKRFDKRFDIKYINYIMSEINKRSLS